MKLSLGYSPCPNDTFIFDAMVNGKIDTEGLEFETVLEDVETLNKSAFDAKLDITKLSFPAYFSNLDKYVLLNSGAALGKGVGPLLVSRTMDPIPDISALTIALPGRNTTANLLFSFAFPKATRKRFMVFSAIEDAVVNQETDLGVIIHENRFTYQSKGLFKQADLGEFWEKQLHVPVPLGGIAIQRNIEKQVADKVNSMIRRSIEFAFANYPVVSDYVKEHSQTMSEDVMRKHIDLYVNNFSIDLGAEGKNAINKLHEVFKKTTPALVNFESPLWL